MVGKRGSMYASVFADNPGIDPLADATDGRFDAKTFIVDGPTMKIAYHIDWFVTRKSAGAKWADSELGFDAWGAGGNPPLDVKSQNWIWYYKDAEGKTPINVPNPLVD